MKNVYAEIEELDYIGRTGGGLDDRSVLLRLLTELKEHPDRRTELKPEIVRRCLAFRHRELGHPGYYQVAKLIRELRIDLAKEAAIRKRRRRHLRLVPTR